MVTTTTTRTFTSDEVCALAHISYRQLDWWVRMGYLAPDHKGGTGNPRHWTPLEAARAVALAGMIRAGITFPRAVGLVRDGKVATLVTRDLREAIIDDLPPNSRPDVIVRGTG